MKPAPPHAKPPLLTLRSLVLMAVALAIGLGCEPPLRVRLWGGFASSLVPMWMRLAGRG